MQRSSKCLEIAKNLEDSPVRLRNLGIDDHDKYVVWWAVELKKGEQSKNMLKQSDSRDEVPHNIKGIFFKLVWSEISAVTRDLTMNETDQTQQKSMY